MKDKPTVLVCGKSEKIYIAALIFVLCLSVTATVLFGLEDGSHARKTFLPLSISFAALAVTIIFYSTRYYFQYVVTKELGMEAKDLLVRQKPHIANALVEIEYTVPFYAAFFILSFNLSIFLLSKAERWSFAVGGVLLSFFFIVLFGWLFRNGSVFVHEIMNHHKISIKNLF